MVASASYAVALHIWRRKYWAAVFISAAASMLTFVAIDVAFHRGAVDVGIITAFPGPFAIGFLISAVIGIPFALARRCRGRNNAAI